MNYYSLVKNELGYVWKTESCWGGGSEDGGYVTKAAALERMPFGCTTYDDYTTDPPTYGVDPYKERW